MRISSPLTQRRNMKLDLGFDLFNLVGLSSIFRSEILNQDPNWKEIES